jgi:hypothetical protein
MDCPQLIQWLVHDDTAFKSGNCKFADLEICLTLFKYHILLPFLKKFRFLNF